MTTEPPSETVKQANAREQEEVRCDLCDRLVPRYYTSTMRFKTVCNDCREQSDSQNY